MNQMNSKSDKQDAYITNSSITSSLEINLMANIVRLKSHDFLNLFAPLTSCRKLWRQLLTWLGKKFRTKLSRCSRIRGLIDRRVGSTCPTYTYVQGHYYKLTKQVETILPSKSSIQALSTEVKPFWWVSSASINRWLSHWLRPMITVYNLLHFLHLSLSLYTKECHHSQLHIQLASCIAFNNITFNPFVPYAISKIGA
jgi:hypothetical protein